MQNFPITPDVKNEWKEVHWCIGVLACCCLLQATEQKEEAGF